MVFPTLLQVGKPNAPLGTNHEGIATRDAPCLRHNTPANNHKHPKTITVVRQRFMRVHKHRTRGATTCFHLFDDELAHGRSTANLNCDCMNESRNQTIMQARVKNTNATSRQAGKGTWQARRLLYTRTLPLRIHSCGCQFGSENEEEHVVLQVRLQIIQQLLPAGAQPLLWSSAQAGTSITSIFGSNDKNLRRLTLLMHFFASPALVSPAF